MIYLWSATPGTGKTCYVVKQLIEKWSVEEKYKDRKIYANIAGLKLEGIHEPPDDFRLCEDGSIIIYDEAQDIQHYSSETRDDPVARALSKHRHRGFDIHFITQDPALLNKWVLKNVFLHYYFWRPAQRSNVEIYTFARAIVSPTKQDFKNAFDKRLWRFEPYYLKYYKSTQINTSEKIGSTKRNTTLITAIILIAVIAYFIRPLFGIGKVPNADDTQNDTQTVAQSTQTADNPMTDETPLNDEQNSQNSENSQNRRIYTLYQEMLPPDYEIIKSDPNLQVRGVIKMGRSCKAYNTHGDLMTLSQKDCDYYMADTGRVHKPAKSEDFEQTARSEQFTPSTPTEPQPQTSPQTVQGGITSTDEYIFADKSKTEPIFN